MTVLSVAILTAFILGALFAPLITPQDPYDLSTIDLRDSRTPPLWQEGGESPFLLGTDDLGRDILSTILYGLRISFLVSISTVLISSIFGTVVGLIAGYKGGWLDALLMRIADTVFPFSTTLMAILFMGLFNARGVWAVVLAISLINWVRYARTARGSTLAVRNEEFIDAIKVQGASLRRILFRHLLPNIVQPLIVVAAVDFAVVIVLESTLSFLGIGVPITQPSLGTMIARGKDQLFAGYWWMLIFPVLTLVMLTMAINLVGDWLRDELDPRQIT